VKPRRPQSPAPLASLSRLATGGGGAPRLRGVTEGVSLWATLIAIVLIAVPLIAVSQAQAQPQRIVSMNLCTDELLMRIVDPARIASITYLSRQSVNAPLGLDHISASLPVNHGLAEEVIRLKPDLVLGGQFAATTATSLLRHLGHRVEIFPPENSFADMRSNIRRLGTLVGEEARAEAVITDFDTRLAALQARIPAGDKPIFADIGVNNYIAGRNTLYTEVVNAGGYRTLGQALGFEGFRNVPLETILTVRPALISTATPWTSPPSMSTMSLGHPALRALVSRTPHITIPERYTTCGAPSLLGAIEMLVEAREAEARK
jgi:iron complex transport system substrate-binding protein